VPFANLGGGGGGGAGGRQRDGAAEIPRDGGAAAAAAAIGGGGAGGTSPPPVSFCDIMTVFQRAVREVRAGQAALELGEARGGDATYFNRTIVILLHLVCLFTKLLPHLEKEQVGYICPVVITNLAVQRVGTLFVRLPCRVRRRRRCCCCEL
jgi:hypothetical protein